MSVEAGLPAAVEAVAKTGGSLPVRGADAEQLDLLPAGRVTRDEVEQLPRGRGRPLNSPNKRTVAWRDYLASRYTHPLETLAAIQATPVDVLAAQLGCKPIEALAVIKSAAAELAPFMEGKMPVDINIARKADIVLVTAPAGMTVAQAGAAIAAASDEGMTAADWALASVIETAEFQEVSGNAREPLE
jgi:ribosomal protein L11